MKKAFRSTDDIVFGVSVGPNRMQAAQKKPAHKDEHMERCL